MLLVFGGSQGARSLNSAVAAALPALAEEGIAVLHAHGAAGTPPVRHRATAPMYRAVPYIEDMHLAYAAADAVLAGRGR